MRPTALAVAGVALELAREERDPRLRSSGRRASARRSTRRGRRAFDVAQRAAQVVLAELA